MFICNCALLYVINQACGLRANCLNADWLYTAGSGPGDSCRWFPTFYTEDTMLFWDIADGLHRAQPCGL